MMVDVAIMALLLWALEEARRRRSKFEYLAGVADMNVRFAAKQAFVSRCDIDWFQKRRDQSTGPQRALWEAEIERSRRDSVLAQSRAEFFRRLREEYEFAARFPLLPVAPDPPCPDSIE
jgi:hypothetical protein